MTQQSIEDRLAVIERKIAELEAERAHLRSLATLQVKQTELRVMFDGFQEYMANQFQAFKEDITMRLDHTEDHNEARFHELQEDVQSLQGDVQSIQAGQQELRATVQSLQAGQHELHASVQSLQAGQEQILAILTGHAHLND